jgi:hypothetical protein
MQGMHNLGDGNVAGLTAFDIATSSMLGVDDHHPPLPDPGPNPDPAKLLEAVFLPHLEAGHCLITFSGGRDSAGTLAFATELARREGLPDPIPATLRMARNTQGEECQEEVVRALGLRDWFKYEVDDELEVLGPVATDVLRRIGMVFPATAYTMNPLLEAASGGTLAIGTGGSDFYAYWRLSPIADVLAGKRRPTRRDLKLLAPNLLPNAVRVRALRRQPFLQLPWLHPEVRDRAALGMAKRVAESPLGYSAAGRAERLHRCHAGTVNSLTTLADAAGARLLLPLFDPHYGAAGLKVYGWRGPGSRDTILREHLGHLLPESAIRHRDYVGLSRSLWGERTRAFAEAWSGEGLDETLVDPAAVRAAWLQEKPDWRAVALLQVAWLHDHGLRHLIPGAHAAPATAIAAGLAAV